MNTSYEQEEEEVALIARPDIPTAVPDNRRPYEQLAVYIILASTLFERIAFYTLAGTLALNLEMEKYRGKPPNGTITSFIFSGISYISTIIFAVISDAKLGRSKTIIVGFFLYIIGYISAILISSSQISSCIHYIFNTTTTSPIEPKGQTWCVVWMIVTLTIIAIGAGAVQSNMAVFGAEQFQESKITSRYFDKYVVVINTSAIFAVWTIRYMYNDVINYYFIPSIVATLTLFIAALLFIIGRRYYIHVDPYDSVITNCIPVVINAFQTWRQYERDQRSIDNQQSNAAPSNLTGVSHRLPEEESIRIDERPSRFLDFAKTTNHGKFTDRIVDDVNSLRRAFIVFTLLIPFWLIYNQLSSTFAIQAKYMYGSDDHKVTYIWLGDPVTIIIGIFILNMFGYKYLDTRNRSFTLLSKFIIGMCLASITMLIAGLVEMFRQDRCDKDYGNNQSNLPIYYQLPQNIFMGFSELFVMVASFEFAYFAAPRSAQTLFMSLRFGSLGIASFIGVAYMDVFRTNSSQLDFSCPSVESTRGNFYAYFYILAGLQFLFIIIFIVCQKKFRIIKLNPQPR